MLGKLERALSRNDRPQPLLAFDIRQLFQILAVKHQHVEREKQGIGIAGFNRVLQRAETWIACLVEYPDLTIYQRAIDVESRRRFH